MLNVNGVIVILSVEDLGICNNERKDSYITLFCKEFGKDDSTFRMTAYGNTAEYVARNIITEDGNAYVGDSGIAGYCQLVSKEQRRANKVKIHARRASVNGELEIRYFKRDVSGVKTIIKDGVQKNLAMTIVADVASTNIKINAIQFIDKKVDNNGTVIDASNEEIDYEALADGVVEDNVEQTTGEGNDSTNGSANFVVEGKEKKTRQSGLTPRS
jgi:hypothetical protein